MEIHQTNYAPWDRTENEDLRVMQALDQASETQLSGLIDELLAIADKQADTKDAA